MIILAPFDPAWFKQFADEKIRLENALSCLCKIEHIGSTAIPGIAAKPVIDILISISNLSQHKADLIPKVETLGYQYNPAFEAEFPHRCYFFKNNDTGQRTHQIHMVNDPSAWWAKHILFRDYLRAHPEKAKAYEAHKQELAKQHDNTLTYAIAKTDFCQAIDREAYFDFKVHQPDVETERLYGYIPQLGCFEIYRQMFQDPDFVRCYGVRLSDDYIRKILVRDAAYWDQYGFGPFVWFEKGTHHFVGEGGLNHTTVEGQSVIELTYSLAKDSWGKGYAPEIGRYAIQHAFKNLGLESLVCFTMTTNRQSMRVMQKLEFVYEKDFMHADLPHCLYKLYPAG